MLKDGIIIITAWRYTSAWYQDKDFVKVIAQPEASQKKLRKKEEEYGNCHHKQETSVSFV